MTLSLAATNPPIEARDLENVPTTMSTSSIRPKCAAVPSPRGPRTPTEWASSSARARLVPGGETRRGIFAEEPRQRGLEALVEIERTIQEATAGTTRAVALEGRLGRLEDARMMCESEIVVRTHHHFLLAFNHYNG